MASNEDSKEAGSKAAMEGVVYLIIHFNFLLRQSYSGGWPMVDVRGIEPLRLGMTTPAMRPATPPTSQPNPKIQIKH